MRITAEIIASWPPPNHFDLETHGPANVIVRLLLLSLAGAVLAIRIYARLKISGGFGKDDVFICFAYVPAVTFVILQAIGHFKLDTDRHTWDVRLELVTLSLQVGLAEQILLALETGFTKLSILALLYRTKHVVLVLSGVVALGTVVFVFFLSRMAVLAMNTDQPRPIPDLWTISPEPQRCIDQGLHLVVASVINTAQDFLIVFVPFKMVLGFDLPLTQRLIVLLLFAGGLLVCIAGSNRTYLTWVMVTSPDGDITWRLYDTMFPSAVELFLGMSFAKTLPGNFDNESSQTSLETTNSQSTVYSPVDKALKSHPPPDLNKRLPSLPSMRCAPEDLQII
ncbi:hypothetical protein QBC36DRAFT_348298 [Triangularia setosa]|uniref:Rhodopsin domain-containing protein n=1 Tax=Triangularia setosa TaxID=2587417 RepID=A0AAN6W2X4_9PEZI|nr:hypothetical protein QBC36DRAFT_348298 [Podospora setosa]